MMFSEKGGVSEPAPHPACRWYVAETLPRQENRALENLQKQGFPTFHPLCTKTIASVRGRKSVLAPVFPGYVFVSFDRLQQHWPSINYTRGVKRLVSSGTGTPQAMPQSVMEFLVRRCHNGVIEPDDEDLRIGNKIKIATGPFADHIATIEKMDEKARIYVLLDILGTERSIRLGRTDLRPIAMTP